MMIIHPRFRTVCLASVLAFAVSGPQLANAQALNDLKGAIRNTGKGIKQTGEFIKDGAVKTGEAIGEGVEATGQGHRQCHASGGWRFRRHPACPAAHRGRRCSDAGQEKPVQEDAAQEEAASE